MAKVRAGRVVRVLSKLRHVQRLLLCRDTLHVITKQKHWILPAGVYVYLLNAGDIAQTRRMVVLD